MPPIRPGLAVILDVVYNHLGPEGNYLGNFGPYFTDRYHTPWGKAINFDGPDSDAVRQFVIDNACMWVRDFHVDGLRLDAVHTIYDFSPATSWPTSKRPCSSEAARPDRLVHVIAESNQNDVRLVRAARTWRLWAGRRLERRFSPQRPRAADRRARRLLPGFRPAGAPCQGLQRRVRLRRLLQPVSPPPARHPRRRDRPHAVRRLRPEPRPGGQSGRWATAWHASFRRPRSGWRAVCCCSRRACRCCSWARNTARRGPFPFFCSFDDPATDRGRAAWPARGVRRLGFRWETEIPDPQAPRRSRRPSSVGLAGRFGSATPATVSGPVAARRHWPALRDRRHTAARLIGGDATERLRATGRCCWWSGGAATTDCGRGQPHAEHCTAGRA